MKNNNKIKWLILLIISILAVILVFVDLSFLSIDNIKKENELLKYITILVLFLGTVLVIAYYSLVKIKKINRGSI